MPVDNKDIEIRSDVVQELLEAVPNWMIRYGNILILCLMLLFLMLSWFIKYPDIIASEATITTVIPPQKEYAKITAKIDSILVKDSQMVTKNQTLAVLENTANFKDIYYLKSIIDTITLNRTEFSFPIDNMPILFLGDVESDYALFENSYIQYKLNKELQPFSNEQNANNVSRAQLILRLNTLRAQKRINESELNYQKKELERHESLFEKGVISKQEIEYKELTYLQAERNYINIDASISQINEAIGNSKTNAISTSIKKTREDINLLKNVIQSFNQLKRALLNWEMTYAIVSDSDGSVIFSKLWTKHQTAKQGDLLFTIIPKENSAYIAKLKTPAQNSGKIKKGQTVKIKLENFPETEFGSLNGKINTVSVLPDENGFYLVNVSLPETLITSYDKTIQFKYEMRGSAEIITEDLRLIERFFYRLKNIFKT